MITDKFSHIDNQASQLTASANAAPVPSLAPACRVTPHIIVLLLRVPTVVVISDSPISPAFGQLQWMRLLMVCVRLNFNRQTD